KYGGDASVVHVESIDNLSKAQLIGRFSEARTREYQELIRELQAFSSKGAEGKTNGRLGRLRNRFQEIVEVDFFNSPLQVRVKESTIDALTSQLRVRDRKVVLIGEIVDDAERPDGRFGGEEGYGGDEILKGWAQQGIPDDKLLERGMELIEGLYHAPRK